MVLQYNVLYRKSVILPSEGKLTFLYKELIFETILIEFKWGVFRNYINDLSKIINGREK